MVPSLPSLHSQIATRPEYLGVRRWGQCEVWGTWKQFPEGQREAWRPSGLLDFLAGELLSPDKFGNLEWSESLSFSLHVWAGILIMTLRYPGFPQQTYRPAKGNRPSCNQEPLLFKSELHPGQSGLQHSAWRTLDFSSEPFAPLLLASGPFSSCLIFSLS